MCNDGFLRIAGPVTDHGLWKREKAKIEIYYHLLCSSHNIQKYFHSFFSVILNINPVKNPPFRGYGAPTECRHLTKSPFPRVFNTFFPTLVMILMLAATYAESVSSMPILERADPTGPILNGITNIVLPVIQPGNRMLSSVSRSSGDIQFPRVPVILFLTTGMVSRMFSVEMKVRLSTRATSFGSVLANQLKQKRVQWNIATSTKNSITSAL